MRFSIKQLLVAVAVVAVLLGLWVSLIRKAVYIRDARADAELFEEYFGFSSAEGYFGLNPKDIKPRNIFVASGRFRSSTILMATLYLVQSGAVTEVNALSVGQSSARLGTNPFGDTLNIRFALGDIDTPDGRLTLLGCRGHTAGAGSSGPRTHNTKTLASKCLAGQITPGRQYIVYVEGDSIPLVHRKMLLDEFARKNQGNYLVVVVELR